MRMRHKAGGAKHDHFRALEVLLGALEEMAGIMYDQARIIEERKAVDEEIGRQLADRRASVTDLISKVEEEYADVY